MSQEHFITGEQESTKSIQRKSVIDPAVYEAGAISEELVALVKELRGLAKEVKAGKMPSARKITQIGRR